MSKVELFPAPPKRWTRFFEWFCNEVYFEELQGDLEERYFRNCGRFGVRKSKAIYRKEILRMFRPSVIKKIKTQYQLNNSAMYKNYLMVAFRNLSRNKLFSSINIVGLAVSMAVGLLAITFVSEIHSYDQFHDFKSDIYRINNLRINIGRSTTDYATTSLLMGRRLQEESTNFDMIVPIFNGFNGDLIHDEKHFQIKGQYAGEDFLNLFTFPLLSGNPELALSEPFTVLITEELAIKIFNATDVVGEVLEKNEELYTITGVLKNPPLTSHIKFDAIASLKTFEAKPSPRRTRILNDWGTMWSSYVYGRLSKNSNLQRAQEELDRIAQEENAKVEHFRIEPHMESLTDIFPGDGKNNQMSIVMPKRSINQVVILALIVLFSACFNYTNLSIARSLRRAKEVGVRKVVGAKKAQLYFQFILEAILVSVLALVIAFFLFKLIRPGFIELNSYTLSTTTLELTPKIYLYFSIFALLIGFLAGTLPALLMSKIKTIHVLKGISGRSSSKGFNLRRVIVGLQFTLSVGFVILVGLAQKQYKYALNFDLGYTTDNIVNIYLDGRDPSLLSTELKKIPGVESLSTIYFLHSTGTLNSDYVSNIQGTDSVITYNNYIDYDYLDNMNHKIIAGQNFTADGPANQAIVTESLLQKLSLGNPAEAIGKEFKFYNQNRLIVGVVENFHYGTIFNTLQPYAFILDRDREMYYMNVKLNGNDILGTMDKIEKAWTQLYPEEEFYATFYSDAIERTYSGISSSIKTFGLLAFVAISISLLGLLGIAVYTTQSRIKEITIRKVLGASLNNLVLLLSKNFLIIFLISSVVAIPLAYSLFKSLVLRNIEYRISVGFWELAGEALIIIIIALLTIGSQTFRAAKSSPAVNLRDE